MASLLKIFGRNARFLRRRAVLTITAATVLAAAAIPVGAQEARLTAEGRESLALTIYEQDLALVSEQRRLNLPAGASELAIEDVSNLLRPETVLLSGQGLRVLEQSFVADLLTPQRLLEASLGKTVRLIRTHPETGADTVFDAEVLSLAGGLVLRVDGQIEISPPGRIAFAELPPGLRSEPALLARLAGQTAGEQALQLAYLTSGLSWRADYVARLNEADDTLDLQALATLTNGTRSDFPAADLRLVAGQVNQTARPLMMARQEMDAALPQAMAAPADMARAPQSASDRYVYTVALPVTLLRGETKQVPLMSAAGVKVAREYRFDGLAIGNPNIEEVGPVSAALIMELENSAELGLGAPLPSGVVRIYGPGPGGQPLFLGEDRMTQTPEGETARLSLGRAFDVTARATRTAFERLSNRSYETGQRIVVQNAKAEAVEVLVGGSLPQGWSMLEESAAHEKESANRIVWRLQVPAGGEAEVSYRIRVLN
ncbi:DUF4139 domain-containing protein [Pelagibius sp.]|uniref:DUF4139 domain-containing protein n=1 Tax=Pelagibius sp. TaxID=1931238 RepID=UPI003B50981D